MENNHIDDLDVLGGTIGADGKYVLTADSVVLLKNTVSTLDTLEKSFEDVQAKIKAMVANLRKLLESNSKSVLHSGSTTPVVEINYTHYHACRALFMHTWGNVRKTEATEKACSKAFERYFSMTGLSVPDSDNPKAIAKREKEQKEAKRLQAIVDLDKAKAEATARDDMDEAKRIIAEKKRRAKEANKTILDKLADKKSELAKLVKDSIDEEKLDLCIAWYRGTIKLEPKKQVSRAI
jgi:hypothetical protein